MSKLKSAILTVNGVRYSAVYDRMCNQGAYKSRAFRWFLWRLNKYPGYVGDFASLSQAESELSK